MLPLPPVIDTNVLVPSIHLTVDLPLTGSDTGLACSVEVTR
jgi:hypothetical protein